VFKTVYHEFKTVCLVQCKSEPIIVNLYVFTCLATMLTSKLITKIIEYHSEF